jgi:preprotein translocase subunit SecE
MRAEGDEARAMSWMVRAREFLKDVQVESTKVSWPTRSELRDSTLVVIVTVLIVAVFIGIVDRVLTFGVSLLFR